MKIWEFQQTGYCLKQRAGPGAGWQTGAGVVLVLTRQGPELQNGSHSNLTIPAMSLIPLNSDCLVYNFPSSFWTSREIQLHAKRNI